MWKFDWEIFYDRSVRFSMTDQWDCLCYPIHPSLGCPSLATKTSYSFPFVSLFSKW